MYSKTGTGHIYIRSHFIHLSKRIYQKDTPSKYYYPYRSLHRDELSVEYVIPYRDFMNII